MKEFVEIKLNIYLLPTVLFGRINDANAEGYRPSLVFNVDTEILESFDIDHKIFDYRLITKHKEHYICDVTFYSKVKILLGQYHEVKGLIYHKSFKSIPFLTSKILIIEGHKIVGFGFIIK